MPKYQAASPDELALVQGSVGMGFVFTDKTNTVIKTKYRDSPEVEWEYLAVIPFNSDRKRMSIVVRDPSTKKIVVMSKGADSIMLPLLR
jgi:magnesium-transporting ATPase (P-type)